MKAKPRGLVALLFGALFLLSFLMGCSSKGTTITEADQKNFSGGPMPESARKIMQERMKAANRKGKGAPQMPR